METDRTSARGIAPASPLQALVDRAAHRPEATALVADGEPWSCGRLADGSARLASALRARGVRAGDRVALHLRNRSEYVLAYLACWRLGAIVVSLKTQYKAAELSAIVSRTGVKLYLGEAALQAIIRDVPEEVLPGASRWTVDGEGTGGTKRKVHVSCIVRIGPS